jgi:hypothetical protein
MSEHLLSLGADIKVVGQWWAPGFETRKVDTNVANFLVERGAELTAHAAAGLGLVERLEHMLDAEPALIDAKGGDGCTPLHFSRNCAVARLLLSRGARVDARDDDHESTPAQWLIGDVPEVCRLLLDMGQRQTSLWLQLWASAALRRNWSLLIEVALDIVLARELSFRHSVIKGTVGLFINGPLLSIATLIRLPCRRGTSLCSNTYSKTATSRLGSW